MWQCIEPPPPESPKSGDAKGRLTLINPTGLLTVPDIIEPVINTALPILVYDKTL